MPDPSQTLTISKQTKLSVTAGAAIAFLAIVWAAAAWMSSVDHSLNQLKAQVSLAIANQTRLQDIDRRILQIEATRYTVGDAKNDREAMLSVMGDVRAQQERIAAISLRVEELLGRFEQLAKELRETRSAKDR